MPEVARKRSLRALELSVAAVVLSVGFMIAVILVYAHQESERRDGEARTALANCQQIENIKGQIRSTVQASVARIQTLVYYKTYPSEKRQAIKDAKASVARFKPVDCYALPVVKDSNLTRP